MTKLRTETTFDALLDAALYAAIDTGRSQAIPAGSHDVPLYDILAYHLGFLDAQLRPARADGGKRIRPRLCFLACEAAGGDGAAAIHAAAAIELLHNFTLIHDDIQDHSPLRRHRETVWKLWGIPQAINAGDAMFSLAYLALMHSSEAGVADSTILELTREMHQTTLRIVEGQVLDLGFEERDDVSAAEYLTMISGKTAAICRFACWAGATIAEADPSACAALAEFGYALGVGFQLRDDLLGVWGLESTTGKAAADDIRRRKKSLPAILLQERATNADRERLTALYARPELDADAVEEVLEMLHEYQVRDAVQQHVSDWHERALNHLDAAHLSGPAHAQLLDLVRSLETRDY